MYDHSLHRERMHFCPYCLQAFSSEEILNCHINVCFKINGKQKIKVPIKGQYVRFKNYERKIKLLFMSYADFESILVAKNFEKQNPNEPYTKIYQKYIACSFSYKLLWVDDTFSKPFKSYLGEDAVYNFINCLIGESIYCSDVMAEHFNKKLAMT